MENIFKTTLKKDVIADIECNNIREVRFPITKFWATRLSDNFDLDKKIFDFKKFKTLEFSSPSNKETDSTIHVFGFVKTYVDGDEFVIEFKIIEDCIYVPTNENTCDDVEQVEQIETEQEQKENEETEVLNEIIQVEPEQHEDVKNECDIEEIVDFGDIEELKDVVVDVVDVDTDKSEDEKFGLDNEIIQVEPEQHEDIKNECDVEEIVDSGDIEELKDVVVDVDTDKSEDEKFGLDVDEVKKWFEEEQILESFYKDDSVFATNAMQIIVLPKGKVLGFKKSLPVNNDAPVRIEFDLKERVYFNADQNFDIFKDSILKTINEIRKNNFVFVCKRNTGVFVDKSGVLYFGIKYSTRKSVGFNRRYNVQ